MSSNPRPFSRFQEAFFWIILVIMLGTPLTANAVAPPPQWWSLGSPPPVNNNTTEPLGVANIGQAKYMAKCALDAVNQINPSVATLISTDLVGIGKPIPSWTPPAANSQAAQEQYAPLLIGQLKAIAAPFYTHLNAVGPAWLEADRTINGINYPGSIFPWTTTTADDSNKAIATIGQLKAVFAIHFENFRDADQDGLDDEWEVANGFNPNDGSDANADSDGDGLTNLQEFQLGTNPSVVDVLGLVNSGFQDSITDSPDMTFRPENPADLYDQSSVPGWQAEVGQHIEIWDEGGGNRYVELQAHLGAHGIKQTFKMVPGTQITQILRYKGRYNWETYDNAFTLKVQGAAEMKVNGVSATVSGNLVSKSFMADDESDKYVHWHYASVTITAPTGGTGLASITISLVPITTTANVEEITYGGFVDFVPVEVEDNKFSTGVDAVSNTADPQDYGYQNKYWIMAPSGNAPNGDLCSIEMKFKILASPSLELEMTYPGGTPAPATPTPGTVTLGAASADCAWHGESTTTTQTPNVIWKIGSPGQTKTAVDLRIAVKTMKRRTVKLAVYLVNELKSNGATVPPDPLMIPNEAQLKQYLNELFAYQMNIWFEVQFIPETQSVNFGGVLDVGSATSHSSDQNAVVAKFGGLKPNFDVHLFLVGVSSLVAQEARGFTCPGMATSWVFAYPSGSYNDPDDLMVTIGHEIGHVFFNIGHPDQNPYPGPAPLNGTDRSKRLMFSSGTAGSRLIVKSEWDEAERWLVARPNGDN